MKLRHYNVIYRSEPEGGFTAVVPSLPGCVTWGKDIDEAKHMAADAIDAYIVSLKKHDEPIPSDENTFTSYIDISHAETSGSYRLVNLRKN